MINFCHIVPTSYINSLNKDGLNKYHMAMANIIPKSSEYLNKMADLKKKGSFIFLDNGTPYLGHSVSDNILLKAASKLKPNVIILPDVLNNKEATDKRIYTFLKHHSIVERYPLMIVVQGNSLSEYIESYKEYSKISNIAYIGIPFMKVNIQNNTQVFQRELFISTLVKEKIIKTTIPHHLLGLNHGGQIELQRLSRYPFVKSCDSSFAYKNALLGISIEKNTYTPKPKIDIDFNSSLEKTIANLTIKNAQVLNECCQ